MKVLFAGEAFLKMKDLLEKNLPGFEIAICPKGKIAEYMDESVNVLVPPGQKVGEAELKKAKSLKLIQQWGVGLEGVDIELATKLGIYVCNVHSVGTGNAEGVAEIAVMLMLMLARRYKRAEENLKNKRLWAPRGISLLGKTAVVVGLGGVGQTIVKRLYAFEMKVIGVNRSYKKEFDNLPLEKFVPLNDITSALKEADFVIVAIAQTKQTLNLFNKKMFEAIKDGAFFINVARGGLVEKEALLWALKSGKIKGAGLDVFWEEPPDPNDEIFSYNVIATPHIGGITDVSVKRVGEFVFDNIKRFAKGETPLSCVNLKDLS